MSSFQDIEIIETLKIRNKLGLTYEMTFKMRMKLSNGEYDVFA